jgi:AraC-like DNA-binding protein
LYVRAVAEAPREWVRAWRPAVPGVREVFHARFVDHVYPPHTHEAWTVFLVDEGAVRYDLETKHRGVAGRRVTLLPPHVVHDGRAANAVGYRKRVLYLDAEVLPERLIGASVDRPDTEDPSIVDSVARVHRAVEERSDPLEIESALAIAAERLLHHLGARGTAGPVRPSNEIAGELRELLDEHRFDRITLADAGRTLHAPPGHLVRSFTRAFGIAPHRYVIGRRIDAARALLLEGEPIADIAVAVGFHDQAHLTRHFRRHVGTTPGRFVASPVETLEGGPPPEGQFRSNPH